MRTLLSFLLTSTVLVSTAQLEFNNAEKAFHDNKPSEALSLINGKIRSNADAQDYLLRALIHESLNHLSNANDDFVSAITLDADFHEAYFHFGQYLKNTGEDEKAISCYSFLLSKISQGETKGLFVKVDKNGIENVTIKSLIGMESEVLMNRGTSYQQLGLFEEGLADINRAIELEKSAGNLINRALLLLELNKNELAIKDLEYALFLSPNHTLAWYNLFLLDQSINIPEGLSGAEEFGPMLGAEGVEAMRLDELDRASSLFNKALELTPNDPNILLNSGRLDYRLRDFQSANSKFVKALKLDAERIEAQYLIGNSQYGMGNFSKALEHYTSYLKSDPTYVDVWFNAGMAYMELKDEANACMCLNRARDYGMNKADAFLARYCTKE